MKRNLTFAVIGLTLGLVSGFKASNYSYRSDLNARRMAGVDSAAAAPAAGQPGMAEVQAVVARARKSPPDFDALHEASHLFVQIQRPGEALEFLQRAQEMRPEDAETLAELAEAYYLSQKFDESIKWARRALVVRPKFPIASYYLMASFVETNTNFSEAEQILAELEAFKPGDQALAQIREVLQKARSDGKGKTVLTHGPEEGSGGKP